MFATNQVVHLHLLVGAFACWCICMLAVISQGGLSLQHVALVLRQVIAALQHLHRLAIIHRDIRSSNVLIDALQPLRILLADFGQSHLFEEFAQTPGSVGSAGLAGEERITASTLWWVLLWGKGIGIMCHKRG